VLARPCLPRSRSHSSSSSTAAAAAPYANSFLPPGDDALAAAGRLEVVKDFRVFILVPGGGRKDARRLRAQARRADPLPARREEHVNAERERANERDLQTRALHTMLAASPALTPSAFSTGEHPLILLFIPQNFPLLYFFQKERPRRMGRKLWRQLRHSQGVLPHLPLHGSIG